MGEGEDAPEADARALRSFPLLQGAMLCHSIFAASAQARMQLKVRSPPLSLTIILGLPRSTSSLSSSRATLTPDNDVSATSARH